MATKQKTAPVTRRLRPVKGRGKVVSYMVIVNNIHIGWVHLNDRSGGWYPAHMDGKRVLRGTSEDTPQMAAAIGLSVGFNKG